MAHILLLEPDRALAETYQAALVANGHAVIAVASGQAAISAADVQPIDAVIMELQLVGHSGIEFLYEFRSYDDWRAAPVIVQTLVPPGEFQNSWPLLRDELGVAAYLYKPQSTLQDLLHQLKQLLVTA